MRIEQEEQRGKWRARKGKKEERRDRRIERQSEQRRGRPIEPLGNLRPRRRVIGSLFSRSPSIEPCRIHGRLSLPPARRVSNESRSPVSRSHSSNLRLSNSTIPRSPSTFSRRDSIQTSETFRCLSIPTALSEILGSVLDERVPGSAFKPWSKKVARGKGGDARSIFRHEVDSYV